MTATNHILTGATIALAVNHPAVAIPLAFVSHFALDAIPHFGDGTEDVFNRNKKRIFRIIVFTDIFFTVLTTTILLMTLSGKVSLLILLACMLASFLPDIGIIYRFFREIKTGKWDKPTSPLMRFHLAIEREKLWGIWVEVGLAILMILLIRQLSI